MIILLKLRVFYILCEITVFIQYSYVYNNIIYIYIYIYIYKYICIYIYTINNYYTK